MSRFFEAIERAERERVLQDHAKPSEADTANVAVPKTGAEQPPPRQNAHRSEQSAPQQPVPTSKSAMKTADGVEPHLVSFLAPTSFEAEQYRTLRLIVEQRHRDANLRTIAVSSPTAEDGKTLTSVNLAGALAQAPETRVLLVNADLRRPSLTKHLALADSGGPGLTDAILNPAISLEAVIKPCPPFNVAVISSGRSLATPYEVLKSARFGELLQEARRRYDYVILDTPPLIPLSDCRLIEKWIDGFLVVVAAHKTPRKLVQEAINVVDPAKMVGLVFNNDDCPAFGYYHHYNNHPPVSENGKGWFGRGKKHI